MLHPRPVAGATFVALIAGLITVLAPTAAHAADRDCGDFSTQKAAQIFFLNHGGPSSDPHRLDADGDGIACDSNPCTCYYGKNPPSPKPATVRQKGRVIKVVDGDTIDVRLSNGKKRRVRLIGIDTPEVYGGTECGGPKASRSLKRMLPRRNVSASPPTPARTSRIVTAEPCATSPK